LLRHGAAFPLAAPLREFLLFSGEGSLARECLPPFSRFRPPSRILFPSSSSSPVVLWIFFFFFLLQGGLRGRPRRSRDPIRPPFCEETYTFFFSAPSQAFPCVPTANFFPEPFSVYSDSLRFPPLQEGSPTSSQSSRILPCFVFLPFLSPPCTARHKPLLPLFWSFPLNTKRPHSLSPSRFRVLTSVGGGVVYPVFGGF